MSLLLNMLSRLVITFPPRSKRLLISWLQSPSAVILEPRKIKSDTVSPSISHEVMGPDVMVFIFWILSFKPTFSVSTFTFIKRLGAQMYTCVYLCLCTYICVCVSAYERLIQNNADIIQSILICSSKQVWMRESWPSKYAQSYIPCVGCRKWSAEAH